MGIGDDEGDFEDFRDSVTSGENERWDCGGCNGRGNSISFLVEVDLYVPSSPGLCRCESSTSTAHVTEGSLARTVSSSTTNTRNTSNSSTSTP